MIVKTLVHAKEVLDRLVLKSTKHSKKAYLCFDTETEAVEPYPKNDAIIPQRARVVVFSMCVSGESYCFPTAHFQSRYPTEQEYGELLTPYFEDPKIIKVMHNANYDVSVIYYGMGIKKVRPIWDTMIASWAASEYREKGLKSRAPSFGRFLRETRTVDFGNLDELANYAEQDVVATDELFQAQTIGVIHRPRVIRCLAADGSTHHDVNKFRNDKGKDTFTPPAYETLNGFKRRWVTQMEIPVLEATIRAERRGCPVDLRQLSGLRNKLNKDLRMSLRSLYQMAGRIFNPNSGKDLKDICEQLEIDNPHKTKKGATSFNAKALNKLSGTHPFLTELSKFKGLEKMVNQYIGSKSIDFENGDFNRSGLEYYVNPNTGSIHCSLATVGAITGRHSSSNPNLQNIPSRKDTYGIKKCFVAVPRGFDVLAKKYTRPRELLVLDYSQLELRVMALYCKDPAMTKLLADRDGDIHTHTATEFGVSRQAAKNLNFLLLYAGGVYMLAETLTFFGVPTSEQQSAAFIERHGEVYPRIGAYRQELLQEHQMNNCVRLYTGRTRHLPDVNWSNRYSVHKAETTLSNNVVQGAGQDFLKAAIVRCDWLCDNPDQRYLDRVEVMPRNHRLYLKDKARELNKLRKVLKLGDCRYRLQVHDEAVFTVKPEAAEECLNTVCEIMSWRHYFPPLSSYNVPLVAEGGVGSSWKEAKSDDAKIKVKAGFADWEKYQ